VCSCRYVGHAHLKSVHTTPAARSSDPATSHQAAASISSERLRESQAHVLDTLRLDGPLTDERLVDLIAPMQSPSGVRTRRAELVALGLVVDSGRRERTQSGRSSIVWRAVK
jgi:hypothetical protein